MLHGRNRPFPRSRGAPGNQPTQAETTSWQAQVVTNGGAVSAGRFIIVNNFIAAEKAAGTWALTDDYWGLWAEDTIGALTSLKQLRMGGSFGAPSFVPSRGYTFDGATNYMNTLFVPSTHAVAMTGTNMRAAAYERTSVSAGVSIGVQNASAAQSIGLRNRSAAAISGNLNGSAVASVGTTDSLGLVVVGRPGGVVYEFYQRGVSVAPAAAPGTTAAVLPTLALFIGALNNNATAGTFRAASVGFACVGASFSAAQEQAQYTNVQAWAAAIGAQV